MRQRAPLALLRPPARSAVGGLVGGDLLLVRSVVGGLAGEDFLAGSLMAVAQALWQALVESIKNAITIFEILTTADFWVGMGTALIGIA